MDRPRARLLPILAAALLLACAPAAAAPAAPPTPDEAMLPTVVPTTTTEPSVAPAAVAPPTDAAAQADATPAGQLAPARPAFSGDLALGHVNVLADAIGSRPAGSANQARAAEYLLGQFRALGYQADLQPFPVTSYQDRGSTLTVAGALGRQLTPAALTYSAGGVFEAELVRVGLGRADDLRAVDLRGKIALVERGEIRFTDKVDNVVRAGAGGVVIYNNQPGMFSGALTEPSSVPVVGLSREDGENLLTRLAGGPVTARLAVDAGVEQQTAANVVATKPGGPETVVIGGHFDSVAAGPGANDNGSGTAVVLELARVLAGHPSPFTIKFVAFDAEEIGLIGSAHMVAQLSEDERRTTRAMINLDMVGVGTQTFLGGSDSLRDLAFPIAAALGQPARALGDGLNGASDHASFVRAGIPSVFLYRAEDPNYHSPNDRTAFIDPAHLDYAGRLSLGILDALEATR